MSRNRLWNIRNAIKNPETVALSDVVTVYDQTELTAKIQTLEREIADGLALIKAKEAEVESLLNRRPSVETGYELVEIEAMRRGVEKQQKLLVEMQTALNNVIGPQEDLKRLNAAKAEFDHWEVEFKRLDALLKTTGRFSQEHPTIVRDWNNALSQRARAKDALENLEHQMV